MVAYEPHYYGLVDVNRLNLLAFEPLNHLSLVTPSGLFANYLINAVSVLNVPL